MSLTTANNNKRIAKNTIILYIRMLFMMLISLYTSRVILGALGVEDYGIYSVVGGFVTLFSILSGSLSAAVSRFITFELGTGDKKKLSKIFSSSVTMQAMMALCFVFIAETIGVWFLNNKMIIPENRMVAANWCLQLSILTFAINLISVPYNAAIVAHEKMSAFAYISILEAIGKLIIAWLIVLNPIDRLIFYAAMIALLVFIIRNVYASYCKRNFEECTYHFEYDRTLLKTMFSFAGWNFLGAGAGHLMNQGVNLLFNIYFGVTVNAARGIATQVDHAIMQFVSNFTKALNPQITKSYAIGDKEYMYNLMFRGAKFSYFLVLIFAIPIICETPMLLELWLKIVPVYTVVFARLAIVVSLIQVLSTTMVTAMLATGDIKKYQIIIGGLGMLVFPMAWLFFELGLPPQMAYISVIIIFLIQLICRLFLMKEMIGMSIMAYVNKVLIKVVMTTVVSIIVPLIIMYFLDESITRFFLILVLSTIITLLSIYCFGLDDSERNLICRTIKKYVFKNEV